MVGTLEEVGITYGFHFAVDEEKECRLTTELEVNEPKLTTSCISMSSPRIKKKARLF